MLYILQKCFIYGNIHIFRVSPDSSSFNITFHLPHCTVYHIKTIANVKIKSLIRKCFPSFSFRAAIYMHEDSEKMKDYTTYTHTPYIPLFPKKICFDVPILILSEE